jgi:hypothetical protein
MELMFQPIRKYADFSGRSRRKEFWLFALLVLLIDIVFMALISAVGGQDLLMGYAASANVPMSGPQGTQRTTAGLSRNRRGEGHPFVTDVGEDSPAGVLGEQVDVVCLHPVAVQSIAQAFSSQAAQDFRP